MHIRIIPCRLSVPSIVAWRTNKQKKDKKNDKLYGSDPFYGAGADKPLQKADFAMKQTNICRLSGDIMKSSTLFCTTLYRWCNHHHHQFNNHITVKPSILAALNFDGNSYEIILVPLILAFLLAEQLVIQYTKLLVEYLRPVIFTNLLRSWNLRNKGHKNCTTNA